MASLVTAYAALRPRDGFSHPHQTHDRFFFLHTLFHLILCCLKQLTNSANYLLIVIPERNHMSFTNIVRSRLWAIVFTKINSIHFQILNQALRTCKIQID